MKWYLCSHVGLQLQPHRPEVTLESLHRVLNGTIGLRLAFGRVDRHCGFVSQPLNSALQGYQCFLLVSLEHHFAMPEEIDVICDLGDYVLREFS